MRPDVDAPPQALATRGRYPSRLYIVIRGRRRRILRDRFDVLKLSTVVRFERRWQSQDAGNEYDFAAGIVYWAFDHTSNLKAFYARLLPQGGAYNQVDVMWQLFFY